MKVLLVANYKPDHQNSMARYAELLQAKLNARGHDARILRPPVVATRVVKRSSPLFHWLGYFDKFLLFPLMLRLRARRADLVHVCDHSNSCYLRWTGRTPAVITAHDMLAIRSALGHFPQNPTRWSGVRLQRWILRGLAGAGKIICVSQKTRQDLESLLPAPPAMEVIPNALGEAFRPASADDIETIRQLCGLGAGDEYLLHVGKDNWYKNRPGVLRILAELRKHPRFAHIRLVIAGASLPSILREQALELGGVVECHAPTDEQLRALYTGALAFLFPSLEEGFGWPIIEAQACGCPVITTSRPPMNEVAGDAAIFIDPGNAAGAAAAIAARVDDFPALRQAGFENIRQYAADTVVDRICRVYGEITDETTQSRRSLGGGLQ